MGYGPVVNGKHQPITPFKGSWADTVNKMCCRCGRQGHLAKDCSWPATLIPRP